MRRIREAIREGVRQVTPRARQTGQEQIRLDLESRAVGSELAQEVAERLEPRLAEEKPEVYAAMLDGVAVAWELGATGCEDWSRQLRDLQELERLMGNFVGELSKVDEALQVLGAYLRRMRTSISTPSGRLFH